MHELKPDSRLPRPRRTDQHSNYLATRGHEGSSCYTLSPVTFLSPISLNNKSLGLRLPYSHTQYKSLVNSRTDLRYTNFRHIITINNANNELGPNQRCSGAEMWGTASIHFLSRKGVHYSTCLCSLVPSVP